MSRSFSTLRNRRFGVAADGDDLREVPGVYVGFRVASQRADKCSMVALLALCESRDLRLPGGETVMDWHRHSVGASGHDKMRSKVAAITAQFLDIDWATLPLLPADIPPPSMFHLDGTDNAGAAGAYHQARAGHRSHPRHSSRSARVPASGHSPPMNASVFPGSLPLTVSVHEQLDDPVPLIVGHSPHSQSHPNNRTLFPFPSASPASLLLVHRCSQRPPTSAGS